MKRMLSIFLCFCILVSSVSCIVYAVDFNDVTLEETISNVSELLEEQSNNGKTIEESAECRLIVKASRKPMSYGDFDFIECVDDIYIYQYDSLDVANKALRFYNNQSCVKWAELDGVVETNAEPTSAESLLQTNDIKDNVLESGETLEKVVVAIVDTGINFESSIFDERVVYNTGINLSNSGQENSAQDDNSHGSNVAEIVVNNTNDNVDIYAYKVLNKNGVATNSAIAYGIQAAIEDDVDVINMSFGSSVYSELIYEKIRSAKQKGIVLVTSSGNENIDASTQYPAGFDEVFTIGSIDKNGNHSFFSNYGEKVDFVALGQDVSASSGRLSGTSFSCPAVSAVAAWILSVAPTLTPDEVKQCLIDSCVPYESLAYHDGFHPISDYDTTCSVDDKLTTSIFDIGTDDNSLYYGYGMPQIIPAVASALNKKTSIDAPKFSLGTGTYNEEITVELTSNDGSEIYYTTDESYPSRENGTKYNEPITITNSTSIRAVAYDENDLRSFPVACKYKMEFIPKEDDFIISTQGTISSYNGSLTELIVPETINEITVTGITSYAFNSDIIGLVLPNTVKEIPENTFKDSKIKYLSAKGVETIGKNSFKNSPIIYLDLPNLTSIGRSALSGTFLRKIEFSNVTFADEFAFQKMPYLSVVNLPKLQDIFYSGFYSCPQLREITCASVETVDALAFSECYFLQKIDMPKLRAFTNINDEYMWGTFYSCYNIKMVDFPNLTSIEGNAFLNCIYLENFTAPNMVYIGENTFKYCSTLYYISLEKVEYIGEQAFYMSGISEEISLPVVKEIAKNAFANTNIVGLSSPNLETLGEGVFSNIDLMSNKNFINKNFQHLNAPKMKVAKDNAFAYLSTLTTLELPNLIEIGKNAFVESDVSRAEFSSLQTAKSLPVVENSIIALSSTFKECTEDTKGRNYIIYGTEGTYAQKWAEDTNKGHTFIPINQDTAILKDLPTEYCGLGEVLSPDVVGFNKTYQWYSNTTPDNINGIAIEGATGKEFNPADYDKQYPYYYCVVTSTDAGYEPVKIRTGVTKNTTYGVCEHNYEAVITAPTCTENGYTTYTCSACGDAYTSDETKALGHTEVMDNAVAPTCTETGLSEGKHCSVCNDVLVEQTVVDALGHTDENDDGICDTCDEEICSCKCHRTGIVKFFWRIINFFQKLFGYNKVCICGKLH